MCCAGLHTVPTSAISEDEASRCAYTKKDIAAEELAPVKAACGKPGMTHPRHTIARVLMF
jgi:hypothetical protein